MEKLKNINYLFVASTLFTIFSLQAQENAVQENSVAGLFTSVKPDNNSADVDYSQKKVATVQPDDTDMGLFTSVGASKTELNSSTSKSIPATSTSDDTGFFGSVKPLCQNEVVTPSSFPSRFYLGVFGGIGASNRFDVSQKGVAFFPPTSIGPLTVDAVGHARHHSLGFVGMHIGYEWLHSPSRRFSQSFELEGYYVNTKKKASLTNPTYLLDFHDFKDTFPINMGIMLLNWGLIWNTTRLFGISPYMGVGLGAGIVSIHDANSKQVDPLEPGVNHFNSDTDASDWVFAVQGKAGLRYALSKHFRLFAEYRFLYLNPSNFTFGATKYPTHVPTTKWKVDFGEICHNMFAVGFDIPL